MHDTIFMKKALELAAKGKGRTSPNPMVGAVVVQGNTIIAEGYHKKAGLPHAEVLALRKAGLKARGATLYVNLEPCCHTDKKTPPCTKAIIHSGVKKVVLAMIDPNPKVSGKGARQLRRAGIITKTGILGKEATKLNEAFIKFITTNKPFVTLYSAGRIKVDHWGTGQEIRTPVEKRDRRCPCRYRYGHAR
jgi:diaminohydroxyphosphoribosylaminopyrimidine deaminase/5-amino-6-(5-phosphoribosylamino)uracil reductase